MKPVSYGWVDELDSVWLSVIHFCLVEEAELVIVSTDRDLEQTLAFADKAFQEANKDKREGMHRRKF